MVMSIHKITQNIHIETLKSVRQNVRHMGISSYFKKGKSPEPVEAQDF